MIQEVKMFGAKCDNCQKEWYDDHNGFVAWTDKGTIEDVISDAGWHRGDSEHNEGKDGEHYCDKCYSHDDNDKFVIHLERKDKHVSKQ